MRSLISYLNKIWEGVVLGLFLAKTNFKLRNEGSYLGILWYLLEPLCFFVIILLIGGTINLNPVEFYPLYLFLGLIMFNFFMSSTMLASKSITDSSHLLKNIKINQESLVMSSVFQFMFSHLIEMAVFLAFMIYFEANFLNLIFYLPIFFFFILFVLGFSFMLAAIGVYISDLPNIWAVLSRLLWFLTPIFYVMSPSSLYQKINYFNPMFHFINISRELIIYNNMPQPPTLFFAAFFSLLFFSAGLLIFRKLKHKFAENI